MNHSKQIQVLNKIAIYALLFILGAITFSQCNSCDTIKTNNYTDISNKIKLLNDKSKRLLIINDSLLSIKQPLVTRYKTIRENVLINIHDTVNILNFVYKCDSVITLDSTIIVNCFDRLTVKDSIISMKDVELYNKDIDLNLSEKEIKKQKRKTILTAIVGLVATTSILYLSFKP